MSEVVEDIMPILNSYSFPTGYTWEIAGEKKEQQEIFDEMIQVMILAVFFIYVFLAVQFESFIHPLTVMIAIPLVLCGVFGALLITRITLTMFGLLGILTIIGVVVANAIVLIAYIIDRKKEGKGTREAILEAAPLRLRPVMMTALTTIIAMTPLALGLKSSSQMFQSMAVGAIGGLLTSTLLTLIIIPVIYSLFEDMAEKFSKKSSK